ncbi:glycosyl transferase family 1 [Lentibacillus kapialis]|uniref:Glycosyl transferase family 1 n=1 Tax=Lentibacillus kapialis TaxID=340214 RepID=A0A917PZV1_9BACI|nr:glycosyltransferase [Lentibacillus kapialis]GGK01620.1 glycosyl transferase family 1 [Lentibacillus kapialis]
MQNVTPIILSNSVDIKRGGLTKAIFTRANTLVAKYKRVIILTLSFQQNHQEIIEEIYNKGLLSRNVEVHNMFEDLNTDKKYNKKNRITKTGKAKGYTVFKDTKQKEYPSYRYYSNGLYVMYKRFNQDESLQFIDYMSEARHRTKREEYNQQGYVTRISHMDIVKNKPRLHRYFDNKGKCYASVWADPNTGKTGRVNLHGKSPKEFKTMEQLKKYWIENKLKKIKQPVIMTDKRDMDWLALKLKHNNLKRVAVIHNNHFNKPFDNTAEVKENYKVLFDNLDNFDKVVFLTQEQKDDVKRLFGERGNLVVIPHPAKQVNKNEQNMSIDDFNPYKAVTLARYEKQKRLDQSIKAFKIVVENIPSAEYHIYGFGKEEGNLHNLIKDLKLQDNVKLRGYAEDVSAVYKSAACSILTSDYEGFGMVLAESLVNGTPAVTYDSKYGPYDIVRDGIDGYVVAKGDIEELADKVIKIMDSKSLRDDLSKNALEVGKRFSRKDYSNCWLSLLNDI